MFDKASFTKLTLLFLLGLISLMSIGVVLYQLITELENNIVLNIKQIAHNTEAVSTGLERKTEPKNVNQCLSVEDFNEILVTAKLHLVSITQNNVSTEFDHMNLKKISLQGQWSHWLDLRHTLLDLPYFVLSEAIRVNRNQGHIVFTIEGWFCNT